MSPQRRLYFDNAATSFPKPPTVLEAMRRYATDLGASPGRGAYAEAIEAGRLVYQGRQRLARLINAPLNGGPEQVVFTLNCTDALNLAIKGLARHHLRRGRRVHMVTTVMDHNSVLRPFNALANESGDGDVQQTRVPCDPITGLVDPDDIVAAVTPDTRLVAIIHGSNVSGTIQPIEAIGALCRGREIPLLVDAAQTLGHLPIDVQAMHIDMLAFPGHKGLLGPLGTGGLYLRPGMESMVDTLREGGTGTVSESDIQPITMPDKYEAGSANAIGIIGLSEGVKWIMDRSVDDLWAHEQQLMSVMIDALREIPGLRLLGPQDPASRCGVFSVVVDGLESSELAAVLDSQYGILTRAGIHCAPLAHQTLGTAGGASAGATRLSLGPFLTESDVQYATAAIGAVCKELAPTR